MFFFFPFATEQAAETASRKQPQYGALPLLPAPKSAFTLERPGEHSFGSAFGQAGELAAGLLKQALSSLTSSMTALGNRANALFAQVAATLAFQRMASDAASFFGMFLPGFAQPAPQNGFAGSWIAPAPQPPLFSAFGLPGLANPWAGNPWALFTEATAMWTNFLLPATAPRRSPYNAPAPFTTTFAFPGFAWNFTFG
ncbi:MAG: hypothetical protein WA384_18520 [Rhodomicrobium sp.]